ncbi:RING finger protein 32-like [Watersipora subatra]|uniref:RING finger protein 32-like n=1 Tax=Watersipora subatra TaxID=2589382 RepID=UPI00355BC723
MRNSRLKKQSDMTEKPDALTAVALQDHLMRNMNLELSMCPKRSAQDHLGKKLAYRKPKGKAVVDTNRKKYTVSSKSSCETKEYILEPQPPPPTLAQRLGLVEQPRSLLNETEWAIAKSKAQERHDFSQPCVICKEDIGKLCHVILSCSHVFHKNCLQAFERFSGKKACPMCRKEQYQTRVVYDGADAYKHKSAMRIQACWRGFIVRCWYKKLRETLPPSDPKLRQAFYETKLQQITDRMVASLDLKVNSLLHEVSKNLENSRQIFELFDARQKTISVEAWHHLYKRALSRQESDCPICLTSVSEQDERPQVLTSCSHLFHEVCLRMFETLADSEMASNSCPVCRSVYQKQQINLL